MLGLSALSPANSPLKPRASVRFAETAEPPDGPSRSTRSAGNGHSRKKPHRSHSEHSIRDQRRHVCTADKSYSKSQSSLNGPEAASTGKNAPSTDGTPRRRVHKRHQALREEESEKITPKSETKSGATRSPLAARANLAVSNSQDNTPSKKLSRSGSLRYIMSPGAKLFKTMNARMLARTGPEEKDCNGDKTPDTPKRKRNPFGTLTTKLGTLTGSASKRARKDVRSAQFENGSQAKGPGCMFGVPLDTVMRRERQRWGPEQDVPTFVENAISRLVEVGLDVEGIFRLSVDHSELMELRKQVDDGKQVDFSKCDPLLVACFLKQYIRELPADSLFPVSMHASLFDAVDAPGGVDIPSLKAYLATLPDDNWRLLRELLRLWALVASHAQTNKMTAGNMAITNGPNILKPDASTSPSGDRPSATSAVATAMAEAARASRVSQIVEALICNVDVLFDTVLPVPAPTPRLSSPARVRRHEQAAEYGLEDLQYALGSLHEDQWEGLNPITSDSGELPEDLDDVVVDLEGALEQIDDILDTLC